MALGVCQGPLTSRTFYSQHVGRTNLILTLNLAVVNVRVNARGPEGLEAPDFRNLLLVKEMHQSEVGGVSSSGVGLPICSLLRKTQE